MNGRTHRTIGAICGITYVAANAGLSANLLITVGATVGGYLGGLIPDIDKRSSTISQKARVTSFMVETVCGHRGVVHTPFAALLIYAAIQISLLIKNYSNPCAATFVNCLFIGYISHLLLDALTPRGIMLFFPITTKYFSFIKLKTKARDILIRFISYVLLLSGFMLGILKI